jgi:light-regulated signal transduction histidine kinase (bacteriophytochrome)
MNELNSNRHSGPGPDLSTCDKEPIHIPGAIQPHGAVIICSLPDWIVVSTSQNSVDYLGLADTTILGRQLSEIFPEQTIHRLRNTLQHSAIMDSVERLSDLEILPGGRFEASVGLGSRQITIELERQSERGRAEDEPLAMIKSMLAKLQDAGDLRTFFDLAAQQFRAMTGFDRVMIYKFLHDDSGQVIAESRRSDLTPFFGLRYPASDIPQQARELYKKSWLRQIPDVDYGPVPLEPPTNAVGEPFDLSRVSLRSVSPIHIEYLQNMGVGASLSISIIVEGELWGLVACHHTEARVLAPKLRAAAELFGQIFSMLVDAKQRAEEYRYEIEAQSAHNRLLSSMSPEVTVFENLAKYKDLLFELIAADGIGIFVDGKFSSVGAAPGEEDMGHLIEFLNTASARQVFETNELSRHLPSAQAYAAEVSGVLAIPISKASRDYLLFFRREVVQSITWAGDPKKLADANGNGTRLSPRKSFDAWRETVRGQSVPWTAAELRVTEALRIALLEVVLRHADLAAKVRQAAHERQEFLIAELNHRVKNTLALIRSLIRSSREAAQSLDAFTANLEQRIIALSSAHDQLTRQNWSPAPLRTLLRTELKPYLKKGQERVSLTGPAVKLDPRAHTALAMVFHELTTNAVKYGALSSNDGRVAVAWQFNSEGDLDLQWDETGGPEVASPSRHGFGSTVIQRALPFELGGKAEVTYPKTGLVARFTIPAKLTSEGNGERPAESTEAESHSMPPGLRLLVVEDNMIIALDLEEMLRRGGAASVDVVSSVAEALRLIDQIDIDAAILDLNLGAEDSIAVAERLFSKSVPIVFATGYGERAAIPEHLAGAPIMDKPYNEGAINDALSKAIR